MYTYKKQNDNETIKNKLVDENNSPIQLITQIKGYFYINTLLSVSLAITLFSFVGIPPIAGFFAKQMILSAALDKNFIFLALVAIITSVIGAAYYLNLIKEIFFFKSDYIKNPHTDDILLKAYVGSHNDATVNKTEFNKQQKDKLTNFKPDNITISSALSVAISVITLLLVLFIFIPEE